MGSTNPSNVVLPMMSSRTKTSFNSIFTVRAKVIIFDLRASAAYSGGAITGNWSESSRNAAGTLSGKVEGAGFQVVAKGQTFSANLNLVTRGANQSVTIKSQDAQAKVRGATITLQRG